MTPRGLIKLTAVANNIEAMRAWKQEAETAERNGYGALVCKHYPSGAAGWRRIDKARAALRADIAAQEPQP